MYCHRFTSTGSIFVIHIQPHRFQGIQQYQFLSKTTVLCGIGQIIVGWGNYGQSIFRVIFACGRTGNHYLRVQLVSDIHRPNKKSTYNILLSCSMVFDQISLGGISWHMKPVPVIFLFSASRESLSQTCNCYWNPFLVRK